MSLPGVPSCPFFVSKICHMTHSQPSVALEIHMEVKFLFISQTWYQVYGFCFVLREELSVSWTNPPVCSQYLTAPCSQKAKLVSFAWIDDDWAGTCSPLSHLAWHFQKKRTSHWALAQFCNWGSRKVTSIRRKEQAASFSKKVRKSLQISLLSLSLCLQKPSLAFPT